MMNMKKGILCASLALNVALIALVIFLLNTKAASKSTDFSFGESGDTAFLVNVEDNDIVFMGEDRFSNCNWSVFLAKENVKSLAISGNTILEDMDRLDQYFKNVQPSQFFLMYGEQELLSGKQVGQIATDYTKFLTELKQRFPATEVVLMTVLPISKSMDHDFTVSMAEKIRGLNIHIKAMANNFGYSCIDMCQEFSDNLGGLSIAYGGANGFYLSRTGYVVMKSRIKDYLE